MHRKNFLHNKYERRSLNVRIEFPIFLYSISNPDLIWNCSISVGVQAIVRNLTPSPPRNPSPSTFVYINSTVCSCHVTYAFQSESTLYSCLNVKELLPRSRRKTWSLSDYNWTPTHNPLVHKWKLNHLTKLA